MPLLLKAIISSVALGALVGLIRQWRTQNEEAGQWDFGGLRTYAFWAMLGCVGAYAADEAAPLVLAALLLLVGAQQLIAPLNAPVKARPGGTSFAACLLTFFTGCLMQWQQPSAAVLVAATTAVLIGSKPALHGWTRSFSRDDLRATLQFAAITGVILPLVPDEDFGPYGAFNPFSVWLMVVLISGVGFAGYVVMRMLGPKAGILWSSLLGGLASSTATTLAFSRRSGSQTTLSGAYAMAVILASTVMLPRVVLLSAAVNRQFALQLIVPLAFMAVPGLVYIVCMWRREQRRKNSEKELEITNPLGLSTALKFGGLYVAVTFLVKAAQGLGWADQLLPLSFISGIVNMDAITLSLANQSDLGEVAVQGIVLAVIANTLLKGGIVFVLGSKAMKPWTLFVLGMTVLFGVAWLVFERYLNVGQ